MYAHGELDLKFFAVFFFFLIRQCQNKVAKYFVEWRVPGSTQICKNQRPKMPRKVVTTSFLEKNVLFSCNYMFPQILKSVSKVLSPRLQNFITSSVFAVEAKFKVLWKRFEQDNFSINRKLGKS